LAEFKTLLVSLANDVSNNFMLVDSQNLLQAGDWANELHPYPNGFKAVAERFVDTLRIKFPGRI
jgi:hypothetical protein